MKIATFWSVILSLFILIGSEGTLGQPDAIVTDSSRPDLIVLKESPKLFTVKYEFGKKGITFHLVHKEVGKINFKDDGISFKATLLPSSEKQRLEVQRAGTGYYLATPENWSEIKVDVILNSKDSAKVKSKESTPEPTPTDTLIFQKKVNLP